MITVVSVLSPVAGIGLYLYLRKFDVLIVNLSLLMLLISVIADVLSVFVSIKYQSSLFILNIYCVLNMVLVLLQYYPLYLKSDTLFRYLIVVPFVAALLMNGVLFIAPADRNIGWVLCTIVVEILSFGHLRKLGTKNPVYKIHMSAEFWLSLGLFTYSSLSFFIFALEKYLLNNYSIEIFLSVWVAHNTLNIFKNGCLATAIWWAVRRNPLFDIITPELTTVITKRKTI